MTLNDQLDSVVTSDQTQPAGRRYEIIGRLGTWGTYRAIGTWEKVQSLAAEWGPACELTIIPIVSPMEAL